MSERAEQSESSDTTHTAILYNVIAFQRRLSRQIDQLASSVANLHEQLQKLDHKVQQLVDFHDKETPNPSEAT